VLSLCKRFMESLTKNLFPESSGRSSSPLAERMRPKELDDFVGQEHITAEGRLLSRIISNEGSIPSLILWGPPGTGKTTLARLLASRTGANFVQLSAVFSGVKEVRGAIAEAASLRRMSKSTVLFIDEIHRFNKAQQDALLAAVEDGTVTLIGATTENPSFEINAALLSRCQVLILSPLDEAAIRKIIQRALTDKEAGVATLGPELTEPLLTHLARSAGGDARVALTALETATLSTRPESGVRKITEETLVEALGRARFAYDKGGEEHYNLASALIKSLRNSDVNAALYWLARLIEGGADPLFIARRLCILASEDIGLADPNAMVQASSAAEITRLIGLPEALYPLTQATIYLARAPKSNAVKRAYFKAAEDAARTSSEPVPLNLRNAVTPLMKKAGYGQGYSYVHDDPVGAEQMRCLPEKLGDAVYFEEMKEEGLENERKQNG
jgi:putative ATPase